MESIPRLCRASRRVLERRLHRIRAPQLRKYMVHKFGIVHLYLEIRLQRGIRRVRVNRLQAETEILRAFYQVR